MSKEERNEKTGCEECGMCSGGGMDGLAAALMMSSMGPRSGGMPGMDEIEMALSGQFPGMLGEILSGMENEDGPSVRVIMPDGMPGGLGDLLNSLMEGETGSKVSSTLKDEERIPEHLRESLDRFISLAESGNMVEVNSRTGAHEMAIGQGIQEKEDCIVFRIQGKCPRVIDVSDDPGLSQIIINAIEAKHKCDGQKKESEQLRDSYQELQIRNRILSGRIEETLSATFPELQQQGADLTLHRNMTENDQAKDKTFHVRVNGEPRYELQTNEELDQLALQLEGIESQMNELEESFNKIIEELKGSDIDQSLAVVAQSASCENMLAEDEFMLGIGTEEDRPCIVVIGNIDETHNEVPGYFKRDILLAHISGKKTMSKSFMEKLGVTEKLAEIEQLLESL